MRTISVGALKQKIRRRTDQENSSFIDDEELLEYINEAYAEYYGIITTIYEDYNISVANIDTVDGANMYNLPSNLFKLNGIDYSQDGQTWISLDSFTFGERNSIPPTFYADNFSTNCRYRIVGDTIVFLPTPPVGKTIRLWYTPTSPILTTDTQLIDGINGYEDLIIAEVGVKIMIKSEQDPGPFIGAKKSAMRRIQEEAPNRDLGKPAKVTDSRNLEGDGMYPYNFRRLR